MIDEAHRLRNVYKTNNKIAREIKAAIQEFPKILLTATPLQNSLLELFGLVSIVDEHVFGDLKSFKANYARVPQEQELKTKIIGSKNIMENGVEKTIFIRGHISSEDEETTDPKRLLFTDLKLRLKPICIRTLRRQVLEYINYRNRLPITQDYIPTEQEITLYNGMSTYLQREFLYALPSSQRQLMTLILRKLLASSSFAIASTLDGLVFKLDKLIEEIKKESLQEQNGILEGLSENYESLEETADEWIDDEEDEEKKEKAKKKYTIDDIPLIEEEKKDLQRFRDLAKRIFKNSKGESLLIALKKGFEMTEKLGAQKKTVIFTESTITQKYLLGLLSENGYEGKIILFNGSNTDQKSKEIYSSWLEKNKDTDKITGSKTSDLRAALVEYFKSDAEIMIATEAAAEGINLQFCSLVINYDLPWNPQRIEQRIGRCHRYGQKHDVVVVNFVNRKNAADQRVYDLLDQKFKLFKGVFGASDEILGTIESGVDFEKRIAIIYQSCRTDEEINKAFDALQVEMEKPIQEGIRSAKEQLLQNFDTEVHEKLKLNLQESRAYLDMYERWLWDVTQYYLGDKAEYKNDEYSFMLKSNPFSQEKIEEGPYKIGKNIENAHVYRPGHPLAQLILKDVKNKVLPQAQIAFDYSNHGKIISPLKELVGKSGILKISLLSIESFEIEDTLIISGLTDQNDSINSNTLKRLFSLKASVSSQISEINEIELQKIENEKVKTYTSEILDKNSVFFDDEVEKLDKWTDDKRTSFKEDLKQIDDELKTLKKEARQANNLPEKLEMQKKIRDLNTKRDIAWRKYDEAAKLIDEQRDGLLNKVEKRLRQKTMLNNLFTIRWRVI